MIVGRIANFYLNNPVIIKVGTILGYIYIYIYRERERQRE